MPHRWTPAPDPNTDQAPNHAAGHPSDRAAGPDGSAEALLYRLDLWPHRSLTSRGFSGAIWLMFAGAVIAALPFIGTIAFWVLLIFMLTALAALWTALRASDRDRLREELLIYPDRMALTHWTAKGQALTWEANPYWVRLTLHRDAKLENYLTLKGQSREVELGAFLSSEERARLRDELALVLGQLKS